MLVLRYFGYVGGSLLALLLVCNAVFPTQPLPSVLSSDPDRPAIRIHSDQKWPERVVFDTRMAPVTAPAPAPVTVAKADTPVPPKVEAPSFTAKARVREAFAQFTPGDPKPETKADLKPQAKHKMASRVASNKVAKVHVGRPLVLASQQPHFGWFDNTW